MCDQLQRTQLWNSIEVFLLSGNFLEVTNQNEVIIICLRVEIRNFNLQIIQYCIDYCSENRWLKVSS